MKKLLSIAAALVALAAASPAAAHSLAHGRLGKNLYTVHYLDRLAAFQRRNVAVERVALARVADAARTDALLVHAQLPVTQLVIRDRAVAELPRLNRSIRKVAAELRHDRRSLAGAQSWKRDLYLHGAIPFFSIPPHQSSWLCIHWGPDGPGGGGGEGAWRDSGDPYWGGLQMDRGFMAAYAPGYLLRRGFADRWSPIEQMWVAERALQAGRGFYPWPNTARACGLI